MLRILSDFTTTISRRKKSEPFNAAHCTRVSRDREESMKRTLPVTIAAASRFTCVLLCSVLSIGWLLGGWYRVTWTGRYSDPRGYRVLGFSLSEGRLSAHRALDTGSGWVHPTGWELRSTPGAPQWQMWIGYRNRSAGYFHTGWERSVPLWMPLLLFGLPTLALRRRHHAGQGLCPCGYSQAGLSRGAVCPECGRAAAGPES